MIFANFDKNEKYKVVTGLWQYDYGRILRIQGLNLPTAVEIHFSLQESGGASATRIGLTKDNVTDVIIPDSMLENGDTTQNYKIYVFIYLTDATSGQTQYRIDLPITSRPKPEGFQKPSDTELFRQAIQEVNDSAKRSAESEKQAKRWAVGDSMIAGSDIDNAKYYSEQAKADATKTNADKKAVAELVKKTANISQQVVEVEKLSKEVIDNALKVDADAKQVSTDKQAVDTAKQEVDAAKQAIDSAKTAVDNAKRAVDLQKQNIDNTVTDFGMLAQTGLDAINQAGTNNINAVNNEGKVQKQAVTDEGTVQKKAVTDTGTAEVGKVAAEGTKQLKSVQDAAAGIVADRQQIQKNATDVTTLKEDFTKLETSLLHEYNELIPFVVSVGCFSKVGWKFYIDSWATGYNYSRLTVKQGEKYIVNCFGNTNAQGVMFFSGEPSQESYITGHCDDEQIYLNKEIVVPSNATTMLVQTVPNKTPISINEKSVFNLKKSINGKMFWQILDGELTVVSKYGNSKDLVVKFGKRGPNNIPDFKSFSTCLNDSKIPSSGSNSTEFIKSITDWHSPFQIKAVNNADGDKGMNYNYTGGNHNYNNGSAIGEGLATARCDNLTYWIDGVETTIGSGYSSNIVAEWTNYVQANNTIKVDGSGREVLKEHHKLSFNNGKFTSEGYIELLENVHIDQYYGYQIYGLNLSTAFNSFIRFIGAKNRGVYTDISVEHESGNADCNGIEVVGTENSCRLILDTSYDLGKRILYDGTKGCYNTKYQKAYTNLINAKYGLPKGDRYYSRATWEFYPTT